MNERTRMKLWMTLILVAILAGALWFFNAYVNGLRGT